MTAIFTTLDALEVAEDTNVQHVQNIVNKVIDKRASPSLKHALETRDASPSDPLASHFPPTHRFLLESSAQHGLMLKGKEGAPRPYGHRRSKSADQLFNEAQRDSTIDF